MKHNEKSRMLFEQQFFETCGTTKIYKEI